MRLARSAVELFKPSGLYEFLGAFRSPFRGVYENFEEARRAVPPDKKLGYDHPEAAALHHVYSHKLRLSDYPILFWLAPAIEENTLVFDLGGHIGLAYYAFKQYLHYPATLRWIVCELPEVAKTGAALARERNARGLSFTTDFHEAEGADILLAAGALQYIEVPFSTLLSGLHRKPRRLLINRLPLGEGDSFVTLQNLGVVINPYQVFNRKNFIDSILALDYELTDSWEISEPFCGSCVIPFHADKSVHPYSGLYFRLTGG